jgi:hypothetical protein
MSYLALRRPWHAQFSSAVVNLKDLRMSIPLETLEGRKLSALTSFMYAEFQSPHALSHKGKGCQNKVSQGPQDLKLCDEISRPIGCLALLTNQKRGETFNQKSPDLQPGISMERTAGPKLEKLAEI